MSTPPDIKEDIKGCFDKLGEVDPQTLEDVKWMAAHFQLRDGFLHPDGSRGTIRMTFGQLNDLIAYAILTERSKHAANE